MATMQLIVVHNPIAGGGSWDRDRVANVLRTAGHVAHIVSAENQWRDLLGERPDAFVAAGGDGTVHDLVHALEGRDVPIAILPLGTANNVALACGYTAGDDFAERVANWPRNERRFQLARVEKDGQQMAFLESVGIGAFANMIHMRKEGEKKSAAAVALAAIRRRLVQLLLEARPTEVTAHFNGQTVTGEYVLLECLNLPWYGPRLCLAPHESAESPTVTLCGVPVEARAAAALWISTGQGDPSGLVLGQGEWVEFAAQDPVHVDGELWPGDDARGRWRIQAATRCVRIWV